MRFGEGRFASRVLPFAIEGAVGMDSEKTIVKFEDLDVWKLGREIAWDIYKIISEGLLSKDFGLRDQMRRAAVSIMSNIAEGFDRDGNRDFAVFVYS